MLTRISAMLPISTRGMWVGTFHGLCNRFLRAHHRDAGLPQLFQILDSQDQHAAVKRLLKALNVDEERFPPREVQYFINAAEGGGQARRRTSSSRDEITRRYAEIYAAYDEQCQREGVVDFAELLLRTYELLPRNEVLREHYRSRFRHILVDEFQDTNRLQYRWLKLLAGPKNVVFAVGDDDQSIYRFRGANVGNMAEFERDFRVENVIRLEQNYRSHGNILDAANALIAHNNKRLGKNLWTAAGHGEPVRVYEAQSRRLRGELARRGGPGAAARGLRAWPTSRVLYRSNAQSRIIEHALFSAGIPYRVYGGLRFFERMEIKHALAYLRLAANPDDDGALPARRQLPGARHRRALARGAAGRGQGAAARASTRRRPGSPARPARRSPPSCARRRARGGARRGCRCPRSSSSCSRRAACSRTTRPSGTAPTGSRT